jgi:hypothetical protein
MTFLVGKNRIPKNGGKRRPFWRENRNLKNGGKGLFVVVSSTGSKQDKV